MKSKSTAPVTDEVLAAYLERELPASEASAIDAELSESAGQRRRLDQLIRIRDTLASPCAEFEGTDLVSAVRQKMSAPLQLRSRFRLSWPLGAVVAAAACLMLVGGVTLRSPIADEFRVKSSAQLGSDAERWASVKAYRAGENGVATAFAGKIRKGDGLLFSYTNLGSQPFGYLMIFVVDQTGEVRWFHPAYLQPGENPQSIPINKGVTGVELPELIRQDFAPGRAYLHALFSSRPLRVLEMEGILRNGKSGSEGLALPHAIDRVQHFEVEP